MLWWSSLAVKQKKQKGVIEVTPKATGFEFIHVLLMYWYNTTTTVGPRCYIGRCLMLSRDASPVVVVFVGMRLLPLKQQQQERCISTDTRLCRDASL